MAVAISVSVFYGFTEFNEYMKSMNPRQQRLMKVQMIGSKIARWPPLMKPTTIHIALALAGLTTVATHAEFVNFDSFPSSDVISGTPPANAILTDDLMNLGIVFGKAGVSAGVSVTSIGEYVSPPNAASGLNANGDVPNLSSGDIYFSFVTPNTLSPSSTDSVNFFIGDTGGDLDVFEVRAYDLGNNLIDTQNVAGNSFIHVSVAQPVIYRIEIDFDNSNPYGYVLDNLEFNTPGGPAVPDAGSTLMLGGMAAGFLALMKRSQKS